MPPPIQKTPLLQLAQDYWDRIRGNRPMPARRDLDPAAIVPLLPHVVLMDVLRDGSPGAAWPIDFRYRLLGTLADANMSARYTGRRMSELPHQRPPGELWTGLQWVAEHRVPRVNSVPYVGPHKDFMKVVDIMLPLSEDGETVNMLFCVIDFVPRDTRPARSTPGIP